MTTPHANPRHSTLALVITLVVVTTPVAAFGQQAPVNVQEFEAASPNEKRDVIVGIIRHTSPLGPDNMASVINAALRDQEPLIREAALAAIVSRAYAPRIATGSAALQDWYRDSPRIQELRSAVRALLNDPSERVRRQSIGAIASLDFDPRTPESGIKSETEQLLVQRFYAEPDARVRATIVSGFASEPRVSAAVRRLFTDALTDEYAGVRHSATGAVKKLEPSVALPLIAVALDDADASVRAQAAAMLATFGSEASQYVAKLEELLSRERDRTTQDSIRRAVAAIRSRPR